MKNDAAAKTEKVINKFAETVQQGNFSGAWNDFWANHADEVLHFCKILVLALVIILIALFVGRLTRKIINRAVEKVPTLDPSVGKIFYNAHIVYNQKYCQITFFL